MIERVKLCEQVNLYTIENIEIWQHDIKTYNAFTVEGMGMARYLVCGSPT